MSILFQSERHFQLWAYSVSHAQLLIRSPKSLQERQNIDIAFFGVSLMVIPSGLLGLRIEAALPQEEQQLRAMARNPDSLGKSYALISQDKRYLISAAAMSHSINEFDFRETDLDFFAFLKPGQRIAVDS